MPMPINLTRHKRTARRTAMSLLLLAAGRASHAAFQNPLVTPQSAAMGGASLARTGDSAAIFLNPAAVSGLERPEAYFTYGQLYAGLNGVGSIGQSFVSAGAPTKLGALAVGFGDFSAAGLLEERVLGVSLSRRLFGAFDAGVTGKYLYHKYLPGAGAADPVFQNGTSRGALSFDAGVAVPVTPSLKAALAVRNVNSPDVGLASVDRVPREYQAGLAYTVPEWALKVTADYAYRDIQDGSLTDRGVPSVGVQKGFVDDMIAFRAGASPNQFSAGVGVNFGQFGFDYSFTLNRDLVSSAAGTHQVGIRYAFGGAPAARGH